MTALKVRLLGNGLLLSECVENTLVLNHVSLENGTLLKSASVSATSGTKLYIGSVGDRPARPGVGADLGY